MSTGPEIWEQTDGTVDGFICAVGTGGTLAGVSEFLKGKNPNIVTAAADPMGAAIYSWIKTGELASEGDSITEGIGQGRVTGNLDGAKIDDAFRIPDEEMLPVCFDLLQEEGLLLGGSKRGQCGRSHLPGKSLGPRKDHRDRTLRLRTTLRVEALQPRVSRFKGPAAAALAHLACKLEALTIRPTNTVGITPLRRRGIKNKRRGTVMSHHHSPVAYAAVFALGMVLPVAALSEGAFLRNLHTLDDESRGYCLDVVGAGQNINREAPLGTRTCKYERNYVDQLFEWGSPDKLLVPEYGLCVAADQIDEGSQLFVQDCADAPEQSWSLTPDGLLKPSSRTRPVSHHGGRARTREQPELAGDGLPRQDGLIGALRGFRAGVAAVSLGTHGRAEAAGCRSTR